MSIQDIENAKILKKYGKILERGGISKRILELAKNIIEDGSYKNAVIKAGNIRALTTACHFDGYWWEKYNHGFYDELNLAERTIHKSNMEV